MEQNRYVEILMNLSVSQNNAEEKIQNLYKKYLLDNSETTFQELLITLDAYCIRWIKKELHKTGCYSEELEHDILQESAVGIWSYIAKDRMNNWVREEFVKYAYAIYKNKTHDEQRKYFKKKGQYGNIQSLFEPVGDTGKEVGDTVKAEDGYDLEREELKKTYNLLFCKYCYALLNAKSAPQKGLALCYSRVIPHALHVNHNMDTIPDSKGASAKWAFETMGSNTISQLKTNSEKQLQWSVNPGLAWGKAFVDQLMDEVRIDDVTMCLGDVVYTSVYSKGKIENMAEYMHKITVKEAKKIITDDTKLVSRAKEFISKEDFLYKLIEGGESR